VFSLLISRAGTPPTRASLVMSRLTREQAEIVAPLPMTTPAKTVEFAPTRTFLPILIGPFFHFAYQEFVTKQGRPISDDGVVANFYKFRKKDVESDFQTDRNVLADFDPN